MVQSNPNTNIPQKELSHMQKRPKNLHQGLEMTHHHHAFQPGHLDTCTIKIVSDIEEYISWVK